MALKKDLEKNKVIAISQAWTQLVKYRLHCTAWLTHCTAISAFCEHETLEKGWMWTNKR